MKVWIAYMVPRDTSGLFQHGLGYIEAGDTREEAAANMEAAFLDSLGGVSDEEYAEIRNLENKLHVQEIEETDKDQFKTAWLVSLALQFWREVESPDKHAMTALFDCLATRDVITLEEILKLNKEGGI